MSTEVHNKKEWLTLHPGLMALSIGSALIPMAIMTMLATMLFHVQPPSSALVIAMVTAPGIVTLAGPRGTMREGDWLTRFLVLAGSQAVGYTAILLLVTQLGNPHTTFQKVLFAWAGVIPAYTIPLFTTESPSRANPDIKTSLRYKAQLTIIALGLIMGGLLPSLMTN